MTPNVAIQVFNFPSILQSSNHRAARLSGHDPEDDEDDEFLELQGRDSTNSFLTA